MGVFSRRQSAIYGAGCGQWLLQAYSNACHQQMPGSIWPGGSNGSQIDLWDYTGGNNQKWMIQQTDNGYYKIINVNSGKTLDLYQLSLNNGGVVDQWDYKGGRNQQWGFVKP